MEYIISCVVQLWNIPYIYFRIFIPWKMGEKLLIVFLHSKYIRYYVIGGLPFWQLIGRHARRCKKIFPLGFQAEILQVLFFLAINIISKVLFFLHNVKALN